MALPTSAIDDAVRRIHAQFGLLSERVPRIQTEVDFAMLVPALRSRAESATAALLPGWQRLHAQFVSGAAGSMTLPELDACAATIVALHHETNLLLIELVAAREAFVKEGA